jgi:RNA polymerase sigma-70 factor (ECF subfamily)
MTQENFIKNRELFLSNNNNKASQMLYKGLQQIGNFILYKSELSIDDRADVLSEAIISAFNAMETYNSDYKFTTWFGRIVKNKLIDFRRKRDCRGGYNNFSIDALQAKNEFAHDGYQLDSKEKSAIDMMYQEQLKTILYKEISKLPEGNAKRIMILSVYEGKANHEIMEQLNLSKDMVSINIFRFKETLRGRYVK